MDHPIVSVDYIRAKAQAAFIRGAGRNDHGFNWHAAAKVEWQSEWDRCNSGSHAFVDGVTPP